MPIGLSPPCDLPVPPCPTFPSLLPFPFPRSVVPTEPSDFPCFTALCRVPTEEGNVPRKVGGGGGGWFCLPYGLGAARRQLLTFPVKGLGSGQSPAPTRGRMVHRRGGDSSVSLPCPTHPPSPGAPVPCADEPRASRLFSPRAVSRTAHAARHFVGRRTPGGLLTGFTCRSRQPPVMEGSARHRAPPTSGSGSEGGGGYLPPSNATLGGGGLPNARCSSCLRFLTCEGRVGGGSSVWWVTGPQPFLPELQAAGHLVQGRRRESSSPT